MAKEEAEVVDTPAPNPWTLLEKLATALEVLAQQPKTDRNDALLEKLTAALERVSETNLEGAKLQIAELRQAHRPSNQVVHNRSVFNRRGELLGDEYQKPKLKCIMMIPWLAEWESLNREEVELLNLLESGEYVLRRIDKSSIKIVVTIEYGLDQKTPSRLVMTHQTAFNNDNFRLMTPLADMLRQVLKQHPRAIAQQAREVMTDEEEEALIDAGELSVSL